MRKSNRNQKIYEYTIAFISYIKIHQLCTAKVYEAKKYIPVASYNQSAAVKPKT